MTELVWKGKAGPSRARGALRTVEEYGQAARGVAWQNRLVLGDKAVVLPSLLADLAGKVSLVYIDPPYATGGSFDFRATVPGAAAGAPRIAIPAYRDAPGLGPWLQWFYEAVVLLRDLLTADGSLYVHLDAHVVHYAKVVLDEVFGASSFQREIVWRIGWVSGFKSRANNWIRNHDALLFYTKDPRRFTFHKEYVPHPPGYVRRDGAPARGKGMPIEDVWNGGELDRMDSIQIMSFSGEKVGYPTQKNESLVARIVRASSSPGDLVLDCFVGSGTTAVVAEKLGRRWVACDSSPIAIHTARKRLLSLLEPRPFVVQSAGEAGVCKRRKLSARATVKGRRATIDLASFAIPARDVPAGARASVTHFSQWIDGWCVDWDHREGAMHVGTSIWRARASSRLPLSATHVYERSGRRVAIVKVFDVLGGTSTTELSMDADRPVRRCRA